MLKVKISKNDWNWSSKSYFSWSKPSVFVRSCKPSFDTGTSEHLMFWIHRGLQGVASMDYTCSSESHRCLIAWGSREFWDLEPLDFFAVLPEPLVRLLSNKVEVCTFCRGSSHINARIQRIPSRIPSCSKSVYFTFPAKDFDILSDLWFNTCKCSFFHANSVYVNYKNYKR